MLSEGDAEMLPAARYYESKAKGLGFEFLDDVQDAVDRIALASRSPFL